MLQPGGYWALGHLLGFEHTFEVLTKGLRTAIVLGMTFLMLMLLLRLVLKKPEWAGIVFFLVVTAIHAVANPSLTLLTWITCGVAAGGTAVLLLRFGLLATVTALLSIRLLLGNPLTANSRAWCAGSTAFVLFLLLVLLVFGLYATLKRPTANPT
jgi:hypothetical protein